MGKRIDKEFKMEAVQLVSEPGNTQLGIERDPGISQGIISRWKRSGNNRYDQDSINRPAYRNRTVILIA